MIDYSSKNYGHSKSLLRKGITNPTVYRNLTPPELYELALDKDTNWTHDPKN